MHCHYCGEEAAEKQKFCMKCGSKLEQEPVREKPVQEAVQNQPLQMAKSKDSRWLEELNEQGWEEAGVPVSEKEELVAQLAASIREPVVVAPALKLPTGRGLAKMFFLGIVTLGIYPTVIWSRIVTELNLAASRYDGKRTMPFFAMCTLAPITLGIYGLVWFHKFCNRVGAELQRRDLNYKFGASTFWLWNVLGGLILVGPFIFVHKLMKAMNLINADYNIQG